MPCYVHAAREAAKCCAACGNLICDECSIGLADTQICKKCLADAESVPAVRTPQAISVHAAAQTNWGEYAVPIILGAIAGGIGGMTYCENHNGMPVVTGMFGGFFAGVVAFCIGALWTRMIVPGEILEKKKGVLGLYGVTDYGKALTLLACAAVLFWIIALGALR